MIKKLLLLGLSLMIIVNVSGQTEEELKALKASEEGNIGALQAQIDSIKGVVSGIDAQLVKFPRWETGAFGVIGINFSGFNDWLSRDQSNITTNSFSFSSNVFANYFTEKSFWRNGLNLNIGRVKVEDRDVPDSEEVIKSPDAINLTSLYGLKMTDKFAISTLAEYRSTILDNFNDPGYLDIGAGATWTPIPNMVVVLHPLNYNFVFAEDDVAFESSLGAKVVADYTNEIAKGINWRSNLSAFLSYKDGDLSNWTWVNGLAFSAWKKVGVGFELGLRNNKQEALAKELTDNPLQTYWVIGLTYTL